MKMVPENFREHYTSFQDGHKGGSEELQANQLLWNPWESDGANPPGHPFKQLRRALGTASRDLPGGHGAWPT